MIKNIKLENWKSHENTSIQFEKGVNSLIGTMGSGKSSVMEAIVFAFFGTTPKHKSRKITLDDLIRRTPEKADKAEIKLEFKLGNEDYTIKRIIERGEGTTYSELSNQKKVIESPSTQKVTEQIEKLLETDFNAFKRSNYSEQNQLDIFLDMRPGDRKKKLDKLLKIDRFEKARKNTVKIENKVKNQKENLEKNIEQLENNLDKEEKQKLGKNIEKHRKKAQKLEKNIEEAEKSLSQRKKELNNLETKKEKYEKLEKHKTRAKLRIENIEEEIKDLPEPGEKSKVKKELEEVNIKLEKMQKNKEKLQRLEENVKNREKQLKQLEEEVKTLEKEAEKFKQLEKLEEKLEERESRRSQLEQKKNRLEMEAKQIRESLKTVKDSEDECPVCKQELNQEHKKAIVKQKENRLEEIIEKKERINNKIEKKREKLLRIRQKKDSLLEYRSSEEKLEKKRKEIKEKQKELEEKKLSLQKIKEKVSKENKEKLDSRREELENKLERKELEQKKKELKSKIKKTGSKQEEICFEPDKLEKIRDNVLEIEKSLSVNRKDLENQLELVEEKEKRFNELQRQFKRLEDMKTRERDLEKISSYIYRYEKALEETQTSLRSLCLERLNSIMDEVWKQFYPYDDYYSIRLEKEDYRLQLLDSEDKWVNAEAEISGGERHSAALVMRLALTYTMKPGLQILLLDEPTHNMDSSAVEKLSKTLKQKSSELTDQIILVTHEKQLESATTGKLYRFKKKDTEKQATKAEQIK